MLIRRLPGFAPYELTRGSIWLRRREWLRAAGAAGLVAATAPVLHRRTEVARPRGQCRSRPWNGRPIAISSRATATSTSSAPRRRPRRGTRRSRCARGLGRSRAMAPSCARGTFGIEERCGSRRSHRLRVVDVWSAVVTWIGSPLLELIRRIEPSGSAKYVESAAPADPNQMPGLGTPVAEWPNTERPRIDEAVHLLTLLTVGMRATVLPNQICAPISIVTPWKDGFESAGSLVCIRVVEKPPRNSGQKSAPNGYGFFAKINPTVDHPRWGLATERRLDEDRLFAQRGPTLMSKGDGEHAVQQRDLCLFRAACFRRRTTLRLLHAGARSRHSRHRPLPPPRADASCSCRPSTCYTRRHS